MNTAAEVFATAREISKAQLRNGEYVPTSKLTALGRQKQLDAIKNGSYKRFKEGPKAGPGRGVEDVYASHGVGVGVKRVMKEDLRPSSTHPNVHFGSSITPEMEEKINNELKPDLVRSAKRPLAFHYGPLEPNVVAAAAGGHQTLGNKGRIILNSGHFNDAGGVHWFGATGSRFHETLNHEVAHATVAGKNPFRFVDYKGNIIQTRALGEEARADARGVHGKGLYIRNGMIQRSSFLDVAESQVQDALKKPGGAWGMTHETARQAQENIAGHRTYHAVHGKVQEKYGTNRGKWEPPKKPAPPPPPPRPGPIPGPTAARDLPRLKLIGTSPRAVIGAAAGAAALGGAAYGWREYKHRRGHGGKFVSKSRDVESFFETVRGV